MFIVSCFFSSSLPPTTCLLLEDLLPVRKRFSFDFGKFSVICSLICCVCFLFSDCVGVVCLERKLTYQYLDLLPFGFNTHSCLFGVDVLVSRSRAFQTSCLLLHRHYIYVVILCFCCRRDGAICVILHLSLMNKLVLQVFAAKFVQIQTIILLSLGVCHQSNIEWWTDRVIGSENCIDSCRFPHGPYPYDLMDKGEVTSTSRRGGWKNARARHFRPDRQVRDLFKQEFQARFRIPNTILIQLTDGKALSSINLLNNMIYFIKEQFTIGLCFHLPSLLKQFLHFTQISSTFFHPNVVQILMGCSVLDMLFYLDFSLLEVLFIYTIKMSPKERFNLFAHILSFQFVTNLPDSSKGWVKGYVLVSDPLSGSSQASNGVFSPQCSLEIPSRLCFYHFHFVLLLFHLGC